MFHRHPYFENAVQISAFWVMFISSGVLASIGPYMGRLSAILLLPSYLFTFGTLAYAAVFQPRPLGVAFRRSILLVALVVLAFASRAWSIAPAQSTGDAFRLLLQCCTAITIVLWVGPQQSLKLLAVALAVGVMMSVIAIPFPQISVGVEGDFKGVYLQKNVLGFNAALCIVIYLNSFLFHRVTRFGVLSVFASIICIAISNSISSAVIVFACLSAILTLKQIHLINGTINRKSLAAVLTLVLLAGVLSQVFQDDVLAVLGRDPTLTGRTELWEVGQRLIDQRPVLGYGYQVLSDPSGWLTEYMITTVGDYALQFHNSWINIWFQLGYSGLVLNFICFFGVFAVAAAQAGKADGNESAALISAIGIAFALQSVSESTFGGPRTTQTLLLSLIYLHGFRSDLARPDRQ